MLYKAKILQDISNGCTKIFIESEMLEIPHYKILISNFVV